MIPLEILKKAIQKAVNNGWGKGESAGGWPNIVDFYTKDYERPEIYTVIFSHGFAEAFWKDCIFKWEYHLQQMVLEKEPLKYIKKFL